MNFPEWLGKRKYEISETDKILKKHMFTLLNKVLKLVYEKFLVKCEKKEPRFSSTHAQDKNRKQIIEMTLFTKKNILLKFYLQKDTLAQD